MRRREFYWSLYHSTEKNQLDNLRTDQVEAVFSAIPKAMRADWWIWRDGFEDWKPFSDFPQLLVSLRTAEEKTGEVPPPLPGETTGSGVRKKSKLPAKIAKKKNFDDSFEVPTITGFELTLDSTNVGEDRDNFRFGREIEVRIVAGEKVYSNTTVNISLKGMQLKSALPKSLPSYFNVEIRRGEQVIPLVCSAVKSADGSPSRRVKIETNDYSPALLALLLSAG